VVITKAKGNLTFVKSSGKVGDQFVARRWKGKHVIAAVPQFPEDREWSEAQLSQQSRFREAVSYGRAMLQVPDMVEIYETEAEGRDLTPFNAAVRDYLRAPEILEVDLSEYNGMPGEEIRVKALDDVLVKTVEVAIIVDGEILEQGVASQDDINTMLWVYTTTEVNEHTSFVVRVTAIDLPDNRTVGEIEA
jgi:hypothetical protein